jgi:hypothetical protein
MEDPLADQAPPTVEVAQDLSNDAVEPTDFEDFADWKPAVGVAVIFAFMLTIFTIGILRAIGAPHWFDTVVGALYLSSPLMVLSLWARDQSALRLPGGRILRGEDTARFARFIWAEGFASGARGVLKMGLTAADAVSRLWRRLRLGR